MICSNQLPENDKMVVCRKAYHEKYHGKIRDQILARQKLYRTENAEILKSRRKSWYEIIGKGSPAAREPIANRTRNTLEITKGNTVKTTGKGSTNTGDDIMPRIKNGSDKDFVTKSKEKQTRISCA